MTDLKQFLIDSLKKRFEAESTTTAICKEISRLAKKKTLEKYHDEILSRNGMTFELIEVDCNYNCYFVVIEPPKVEITLHYFCNSKLPKKQQERLNRAKAKYNIDKRFPWDGNVTSPWTSLRYNVELDLIISGEFKLDIS